MEKRLIMREPDPGDARRRFVRMTPATAQAMRESPPGFHVPDARVCR